MIKRPGCTEWDQISLSSIQSHYIIQQWNNGCEHRSKSCGSLDLTLTSVNSIRWSWCSLWTHRPTDRNAGLCWANLMTFLDVIVWTEGGTFSFFVFKKNVFTKIKRNKVARWTSGQPQEAHIYWGQFCQPAVSMRQRLERLCLFGFIMMPMKIACVYVCSWTCYILRTTIILLHLDILGKWGHFCWSPQLLKLGFKLGLGWGSIY